MAQKSGGYRSFSSERREIHSLGLGEGKVTRKLPYFIDKNGDVIIYNKDSRDMCEVADNSANLIVTSPPYGVGKEYESEQSFGDLLSLIWSSLCEMYRIVKPGGYAVINFGDIVPGQRIMNKDEPCILLMSPFYWTLGLSAGWLLQADRIWQKDFSLMSSPIGVSTNRPLPEWEHIYTFRKPGGGKEIIRERKLHQRGIWSTVGKKAEQKLHPAAFPEALVNMILTVYSDPGDLVLDPFLGSGTTAWCCKKLGRKCIGYEVEEKYCKIAADRCRQQRLDDISEAEQNNKERRLL